MATLEINAPPDRSPDLVKLGWAYLGPVMMTCGEAGDMPVDRFDEWISDLGRHQFDYVLGSTIGPTAISGNQRRRVVEALKGKKVVVIIDNRVMRGILTALGWLGLQLRSFEWSELESAAKYLDVPGLEPQQLVDALWSLREATTGERRPGSSAEHSIQA
ncbi:MAG: hypothetical protein KC457_05975 [Myxococcales bacterium]|nr:hypothetical protein [Myxococcales bacterium]